MDINTFLKAFYLMKKENSDYSDLGVMVSDVNHDNKITKASWEKQCEWRLPDDLGIGSPADKPETLTWEVISAYETKAKAEDDYSN